MCAGINLLMFFCSGFYLFAQSLERKAERKAKPLPSMRKDKAPMGTPAALSGSSAKLPSDSSQVGMNVPLPNTTSQFVT